MIIYSYQVLHKLLGWGSWKWDEVRISVASRRREGALQSSIQSKLQYLLGTETRMSMQVWPPTACHPG